MLNYNNDFTYQKNDVVIHWSDKIIIFAEQVSSAPSNTDFLGAFNALDRIKGRLQTAYISDDYFDEENNEKAGPWIMDCELYDREKPKF